MITKVRVLEQDTDEDNVDFSERINEFIKDKEIIDIKYSSSVITYGSRIQGYETQLIHAAMVIYEEEK